jgi:hypothetical protein
MDDLELDDDTDDDNDDDRGTNDRLRIEVS